MKNQVDEQQMENRVLELQALMKSLEWGSEAWQEVENEYGSIVCRLGRAAESRRMQQEEVANANAVKEARAKLNAARRQRLEVCRCPIHGIALTQISSYYQKIGGRFDGAEVAIASCPRRDCGIEVFALGPDGPTELRPAWEHLIT